MTPKQLEQFLHQNIPLAAAMQVAVIEAGEARVVLQAPLEPNINHHGTIFGGSASAVAILAAWSLVHLRVHRAGLTAHEVIQRNTMDYLLPIRGTFTARAALDDPAGWEPFTRMLTRKGRARIEVPAVLEQQGEIVGRFTGQFVATGADH